MRDSLGGLVVIVIIVVFIVVASGYMAFNVNYTRAFRMKNRIISIYEDYNGKCNDACERDISTYAVEIGYHRMNSRDVKCPSNAPTVKSYYCLGETKVDYVSSESVRDLGEGVYYTIVTKIDMQIPIIKKIFDFRFFYITGETRTFKSK